MKLTLFLVAWVLAFIGFVSASPMETRVQPLEVSPRVPEISPQSQEGHKALLTWDPPEAYNHQRKRKSEWEHACTIALIKAGCRVGKIHKGVGKDGQQSFYLGVEGAPSVGMRYEKKLRVFLDGTSQDGWSAADEKRIRDARYPRRTLEPLEPMEPLEGAKPAALLFWDPPTSYKHKRKWREHWEEICAKALAREDCGVGVVYQGAAKRSRPTIKHDGEENSYINVEGAPLTVMENSKKMRVYEDGSTQHGWTSRDRKLISDSRRERKEHLLWGNSADDQKPHMAWDPLEAYRRQPVRKLYWEQRCRKALAARKDCAVFKIHKGEKRLNGNRGNMSYVMVEGASSMDHMEKNSKKIRIFQDATSTDGWSTRDWLLMKKAKKIDPKNQRMQRLKDSPPWEGPSAHLSWDPAGAYPHRKHRRLDWEKACDEALTKEGCVVGKIHQGERKTTENGNTYLRVEGSPSMDMKSRKEMRVFEDGSYVHGWSEKDRKLMYWIKRHAKASQKQTSPLQSPKTPPLARDSSGGREYQSSNSDSDPGLRPPSGDQQHHTETQGHEPYPASYADPFQSSSGGQQHYTTAQAHEPEWDSLPEILHLPNASELPHSPTYSDLFPSIS